jgi:outer membrane protein TolC
MDGTPWRRSLRLERVQADLDRQAATARIEITRQTLVQDVLRALAECRRTDADLEIAERNRDLALHSARLGRRFYSIGRADGLSLSDAESELAAAETRLLEARSAARFSRYVLSHTLGTLIEHPTDLLPRMPQDSPL